MIALFIRIKLIAYNIYTAESSLGSEGMKETEEKVEVVVLGKGNRIK